MYSESAKKRPFSFIAFVTFLTCVEKVQVIHFPRKFELSGGSHTDTFSKGHCHDKFQIGNFLQISIFR